MAKKDVQLVIRAKNEADRALASITASLEKLKTAQDNAAASAERTDATVGEMGSGLKQLERFADRAAALNARSFSQIEKAVEKATAALKRQRAELGETKEAYAANAAQIRQAQLAIRSLPTSIVDAGVRGDQDAVARLQRQLKAAEAAYAQLKREASKFITSIDEQTVAVDKSSDTLRRLEGAATAAKIAQTEHASANVRVEETTRDLTQQLDRQSRATLRSSTATTAAATGTVRLKGAFQGLYGESRKAMSIMQRLRGELLAFVTANAGLYNAINQLGSVINTYRAVEGAQNRLGVVFQQNTARVSAEMEFLRSQANRLGIEFGTLAQEYAAFAFAANEAGFVNNETRRVFLSLTEAGRVFNLTTEQSAGIFRALTQIMSKGKVQAEELRGQLGDRLSGAFQIMAAALGVTNGQLDEMLERGEIVANSDTLLRFSDEMDSRFGPQMTQALQSVNTEIGRWQNNMFEAQRVIGEAGFIAAFVAGLREMNTWLSSEAGTEFFTDLGRLLGRVTEIFFELIQYGDELLLVFQAFAAVKLSQVFLSLANVMKGSFGPAMVKARADVIALTASMHLFGMTSSTAAAAGVSRMAGALVMFQGVAIRVAAAARTMWAAIGGVPGILITAVSFFATTLLGEWLTSTDRATAALERHNRVLQQVQAAYVEAAGDAERFSGVLADIDRAELTIDARHLRKDLDEAREEISQIFGRSIVNSNILTLDEFPAIRELIGEFRRGQLTAAEFSARLNEIVAAANNPTLDEFRESLTATLDEARAAGTALGETEAMMRLLDGTATDADKALLGLASALDGVGDSADTGALERYTQALRELEDAVPELERLNDFKDRIQEVRDTASEALEDATTSAQRSEINAARDAAIDAINREQIDSLDLADIAARIVPASATAEMRLEVENELRDLAERLQAVGADVTETNVLTARLQGGGAPEYAIRYGTQDTSAARSQAQSILGRSDTEIALEAERSRIIAERRKDQEDFNASIDAANESRRQEVSLMQQTGLQQAVNRALAEAEAEAAADNVVLSAERREQIVATTTQLYEAEARQNALREVEAARLELAQARGEVETREAYIARELENRRVDALSEQGQILTEILGKIYDINAAQRDAQGAAEDVNRLQEQRRLLEEQIEFLESQGDMFQADALSDQLEDVNESLLTAIDRAIEFWRALGGPDAELAIQRLEQARTGVEAVGNEGVVTKKRVDEMLAQGGAKAFDRFAQALAEGKNATVALRDAFLQFASDFLRQIAQMIIQQMILNALKNSGLGGFISGATNSAAATVAHTGGVIEQVGTRRMMPAEVFAAAVRYHTGGIAGLAPNEVPAVLERGEEVLTEDDPRHIANGGRTSLEDRITINNMIDPGELLQAALQTPEGETAFMNFIRANRMAMGT